MIRCTDNPSSFVRTIDEADSTTLLVWCDDSQQCVAIALPKGARVTIPR